MGKTLDNIWTLWLNRARCESDIAHTAGGGYAAAVAGNVDWDFFYGAGAGVPFSSMLRADSWMSACRVCLAGKWTLRKTPAPPPE